MESPVRKQDLQTVPEHDDQDGNEDHNCDKEECDVGEICRDECECEINASVGISEVQVRKSEEDPREVKTVLTAEDEALHWLQAVTGKTIENDNVRDALQDGVLLCELINILHPGCVWKINRGASPIAGLDNLGAFLRGCASLGLGVSQLFDPGDLQDPTTRHTLTSSEANRSVKNVLVTIYWLGRAASKLPEYHGAPLNRKAFATLLAQSEETDETDSVLGSSWKLEQSDTPSPHSCPQSHSDSLRPHDRVCCSLDKLEIIGGEVESPATKMPDIQKDDMATRRTSAMADQPRPAAPFNQFLPGQHNLTTGVLPGQPTVSQSNTGSQNHLTSPLVVSMSEAQQPAQLPIQQGKVDRFQVTEQKIQPRDFNWDSEDEERLGEPDVEKDDLAARRGWQGNRTPAVPHNRFLPAHSDSRDVLRWENMVQSAQRLRDQAMLQIGHRSTSLIGLESEPGRLPGLSTYRRRESASAAEVESWQEDFARWKSRRQRASRELWKRKEEREMAEQAHASVGTRLLGTKTYREILEEKQRREQVLQNAYRQARNAGDAAAVLARYREQFLQDFAGERYELPEFLQQDLSLELEGLGLRSTQAPGLLRQLSEPPISTATPLLNAFSASSGFGNFSAGTRMAVSAQTCTLSQMTETAVSSLIPVPETPSVPTTPTTSQAPLKKINTSTSSVVPANVTNTSSLTPPLNTSGSTLQSTGVKNPSNPPFKSFSLDHDSQLVSPALHLFPLPADSPPSPAPLSPSRTRLVPIVVPRPYKSQSSKLHSLLNFTILDADIDKNGTSCGRPGVLSDEKRTDFSPVMEEKKTTVGMDELALGNRHGGWDPEKQRRRLEHWQKQQQKHLEKQFERQQERLQKHWEQVQLGVEIQEQKHREEEIEILAKTAMPSIRSVGEGSAMPSSPSSFSENNSHLRILEEEPEEQCNYLKTDFDLVEGTGRRNGEPSVQTEDCDLDLEGSNVEGRPESRLAEKSSALHQGPAVQTGKMLIGHQLCATCAQPVVKGPAMVIKALDLCFHVNCFKCDVCGQPLAPCNEGTDVRLQDGSLRCKTCDVDSNIEVARTSTV